MDPNTNSFLKTCLRIVILFCISEITGALSAGIWRVVLHAHPIKTVYDTPTFLVLVPKTLTNQISILQPAQVSNIQNLKALQYVRSLVPRMHYAQPRYINTPLRASFWPPD